MKTLRIFLILTCVVALTGCQVDTTKHHYAAEVDFANLNTFDWVTVAEGEPENVSAVKNPVNNQLAAKGLKQVPENPDFLIAARIGKQLKWDEDRLYSRPGYGSRRARRPADVYEEGTLTLDFVDADTKQLIWRGSAKTMLDPVLTEERRDEKINEAVSKILENFPPARAE